VRRTLALQARWTLFIEPLARVLHVGAAGPARMRDCMLCVARDGTIGLVALDGPSLCVRRPGSAHVPAR
jgi:hypothetical protein